jgi:hypothetical protein
MRFSEYLTDPTLEEEGVWVRLRKGDAEVLVARAGNSKHEELVRRLRKKHGRGFRGNELPQEVDDSIALEALSGTILLGWRGIEGPIPGVYEDEGEVPYSTDTARALLKLSRDFRLEVTQIATEMEVFRREEQEAGKKPSRK